MRGGGLSRPPFGGALAAVSRSLDRRLSRRLGLAGSSLRPNSADLGHGRLKLLGHPGIETFTGDARSKINLAVQFRGEAGHELPGKRLVRLLATLGTKGQIIINGVLKGFLQLPHANTLEGNHVAGIDDLAMKNAGVVVKFDF